MPNGIDSSVLHRTWIHSHEDDGEGKTVYRQSDFAFPPSRGRSAMTLLPDGIAEFGYPGPDDRSREAEGRWWLEGRVLTVEAPGGERVMEIDSVDPDVLVVRIVRKES